MADLGPDAKIHPATTKTYRWERCCFESVMYNTVSIPHICSHVVKETNQKLDLLSRPSSLHLSCFQKQLASSSNQNCKSWTCWYILHPVSLHGASCATSLLPTFFESLQRIHQVSGCRLHGIVLGTQHPSKYAWKQPFQTVETLCARAHFLQVFPGSFVHPSNRQKL